MQTKDGGKHDILPVAGRPDHAGLPVMMPRESDPDMRRDGPRPQGPAPVDERGRLHGAPAPDIVAAFPLLTGDRRITSQSGVQPINKARSWRIWLNERRAARLRRQDKRAACGRAHVVGRIGDFGHQASILASAFSRNANDFNLTSAIHGVRRRDPSMTARDDTSTRALAGSITATRVPTDRRASLAR